jgi:hypothetical protein
LGDQWEGEGVLTKKRNKNGVEQYSLSQDYAKGMKNFMV